MQTKVWATGWGWFVALFLVVPIQSVLVPLLAVGGVSPDLPLIAVLLFAATHPPLWGVAVGGALGGVLDLLSVSGGFVQFGMYLAVGGVGAAVGTVTSAIRVRTLMSVTAVTSFSLGVVYLLAVSGGEHADDLARWLLADCLPQVGYDMVAAGVISAGANLRPPPTSVMLGKSGEFFSVRRFQRTLR